ncbi:hypothetical protein ADU37_CDS12840 [Thermococcus sp. 2319x1]|nr:hypothetical protein ADU37_CDS12840 [Thermococcus sp. 2319x1]
MRMGNVLLLTFLVSTLAIMGVQHLNKEKPLGGQLMFFENGYAYFVAPSSMLVEITCFSQNNAFFEVKVIDPETEEELNSIRSYGTAKEVLFIPHSGPYYFSYEGSMPSCTLKSIKILPSREILKLEYSLGTLFALLLSLLIWREKNGNNNC